MILTQALLDRADLVLVVGHDGLYEWSSHRSKVEIANCLRDIADAVESGADDMSGSLV